ncbi:hypothetical protein EDD85DRAFT_953474 [Armillaria nabsnona]|nr:hypothetical protein EDD85DRAFT_953474 [Armillaria nabsnona]
MEGQGQRKQKEDKYSYADSGEEADDLICHYESPLPVRPTKQVAVIDIDEYEEMSLPLPNNLPEDLSSPDPQPGLANKRERHPSHLPSPDLEKRRRTGTLEEFTVVPQMRMAEKATGKTHTAFKQWQLDRKRTGKQPEVDPSKQIEVPMSTLEARFQIPDHIKRKLLEAPNISGIREESSIPAAGPSRRNDEPQTIVPATTGAAKAVLRGQGDTVKGKAKLQQDMSNLDIQKQAEAIILQAKEQAKQIEAKATELWDQVIERRNKIEQAAEEIHQTQWETTKQQDAFQDNNNVVLNNVTHVVDNLLGEAADLRNFLAECGLSSVVDLHNKYLKAQEAAATLEEMQAKTAHQHMEHTQNPNTNQVWAEISNF